MATRLDIDHNEAFALIRARARNTRRMLVGVAEGVTHTDPDGDWDRFRNPF